MEQLIRPKETKLQRARRYLIDHRGDASKLLLAAVFAVAVILPLIMMFAQIRPADFRALFTSKSFLPALGNSFSTAALSTLISVTLAFLLALCMQRTGIRCKGVITVILLLPMLIPSMSHGMGLNLLFGKRGVLTTLLGFSSGIQGFGGIIVGSVLYSFPVAFLMLNDVMCYEDSSPYEAASVLGISRLRTVTAITLPYLARPLISAFFATFTMIITDYGVPLMVGGKCKTLAVLMYEEAVGQMHYGVGGVVGLLLLLPALIAFLVDLFNKERGKASYVTRPFTIKKNLVRDIFAYLFCALMIAFVLLILFSFCISAFSTRFPTNRTFTFKHFGEVMESGGENLRNSVIIALLTAVIGVVTAFMTAYMTTRYRSRLTRLLHLVSITSLAIPGMVLGISYVFAFKSSFLYGSLAILVMVNLMHFFASPYLMMYNTLGKMNENLEDVGHTMGVRRFKIIRDVIIPQSASTLLEMFAYFFVNAMMTISAVSFLATTYTQPLSLKLNQYEELMQTECAAVVALIILLINVAMKGVIYLARNFGTIRAAFLRKTKTAVATATDKEE